MGNQYKCGECGLAVLILPDGEKLRPCGHAGKIILDLEVICTGQGFAEIQPGRKDNGSVFGDGKG
jgi:hypothetical protein